MLTDQQKREIHDEAFKYHYDGRGRERDRPATEEGNIKGSWFRRTLKKRKEIQGKRNLAIACHEAAHCVLSIQVGAPFEWVSVGKDKRDPLALGRMWVADPKTERFYWITKDNLRREMAGSAWESVLRPRQALWRVMSGHGFGDWIATRERLRFISWQIGLACSDDKAVNEAAMGIHRAAVELIKDNFDAIVRLGRELARRKRMSEEEVYEFVTRP
jgi:hypothetical protein